MNRGSFIRRAFPWLLCCALHSVVIAAHAQDSGRGTDLELVQAIDAALDVPGLRTGFQGLVVQSLADSTLLYERNAENTFLPASNNKLLTAGAALALLGPDFAYHTRLFRIGTLDAEGTLHGDLVLRGAGDPILSVTDLDNLARQVAKAGIRRVTGGVRYDDSLFDRQRLGDVWAWDDEPYYYSAQISALNLNENLVMVQIKPGHKVGDLARVIVEPTDKYTTLRNSVVTSVAKSKPAFVVERLRGHNTLFIHGSIPLDVAAKDNAPVAITIDEPPRFAAVVFTERLRKAGVRMDRTGIAESPPIPATAPMIAEHTSDTLTVLLKRLNKPSDNLIAECLLKTVGATCQGQGTSGADGTGARAARTWFQRIGMNMECVRQADGSGLSRVNFVSPRNLVRLLTYLHSTPAFPTFYDSLPIAGVDGTLHNRLRNTAAANNCRAKTGYVSHASSLSGYVTTRDGEMLVFAILMNNHLAPNSVCIAAQDRIVTLLANYTRSPKGVE